jgi:hypothetical protein
MSNKPPTTSAIKPGTAVYATTDLTDLATTASVSYTPNHPYFSSTRATGITTGAGVITDHYAPDDPRPHIRVNDGTSVTIDKLKLGDDAELLNARLKRIELALGITTRLPTLESTYADLHEAGENMDHVIKHARHINEVVGIGGAYIALTKECEIMEKLKSNNDPEK